MRIYVDLCGCDAEERAKCDMLIYCMEDFGAISRPNRFKFRTGALSEEERQEVAKKICDEELPRLVKLIESHMGEKWLLSKVQIFAWYKYVHGVYYATQGKDWTDWFGHTVAIQIPLRLTSPCGVAGRERKLYALFA